MKIDIFNHIFPASYFEKILEVAGNYKDMGKRVREIPALHDLEARFRVMDQFEDYAQVICLSSPPLEVLGGPKLTPELAKAANDGMAEYVSKYPDRFPAFIASLPLNNPDACLEEIDRSINDLKAVGIQFFTNIQGKPLDLPEFKPLFERIAEHDLPIWLHPARGANFPDYLTEDKSKYEIWWTFGWPYETSVAMSRIVFAKYSTIGTTIGCKAGLPPIMPTTPGKSTSASTHFLNVSISINHFFAYCVKCVQLLHLFSQAFVISIWIHHASAAGFIFYPPNI